MKLHYIILFNIMLYHALLYFLIIRKEQRAGVGEDPAKPFLILADWFVLLTDLATPASSGPEQASERTNKDNKYIKMKPQPRSTSLDTSQEPFMVPHDES